MTQRGSGYGPEGSDSYDEASLDASLRDLVGTGDLGEAVLARFRSPRYQPPSLPEVAMEVLKLTQDASAPIRKFVSLLERDTLIAGRVLKQANSPFYCPSMSSQISSIQQAVVRLGMINLRNLVMEVWLGMSVFRAEGFADAMRRVSHHSTVTAHACDLVARRARVDTELAFLGGLLHDVGIAGALAVVAGDGPTKTLMPAEEVYVELDLLHTDLSSEMLQQWGLPTQLQNMSVHHHMPNLDGSPVPLSAIVCVAEELSNQLGYSVLGVEMTAGDDQGFDCSMHGAVERSWDRLAIPPDGRTAIRDELSEVVARLDWL